MANKKTQQPTMPNVSQYEFIGVNSGGAGFMLGNVKLRWATITDARIEHLLNLDNDLWSRYWKKKKATATVEKEDKK